MRSSFSTFLILRFFLPCGISELVSISLSLSASLQTFLSAVIPGRAERTWRVHREDVGLGMSGSGGI